MASMRDVARAANVAMSTVSAVVNNVDCVKPSTKQRILDAMEELGYVPNPSARSLAARKALNIGIVSMNYDDPDAVPSSIMNQGALSYYPFIQQIVKCLEFSGFGILLENFCYNYNEDTGALPSIVEQRRVDGVIILGSLYTEEFIVRLRQKLDAVVVLGSTTLLTDHVQGNYDESIAMGVRYLVEKGHRRIAYACGDSQTSAYQYKLKGYVDALTQAKIELNPNYLYSTKYSVEEGYEAAKRFFSLPKDQWPTALICASDVLAAGAYRYFHEAGLRIPEDVSVMGYENMIIGDYMLPSLSTIDWNKKLMATEACRIMMEKLKNGSSETQSVVVPCTIVERASVKDIS